MPGLLAHHPSQPPTPPVVPQIPTRPFQAIAAYFFALRGTGYLVIVDRFSRWSRIVASLSGARCFRRALLSYFSTFGVHEELSTDGGPDRVHSSRNDGVPRTMGRATREEELAQTESSTRTQRPPAFFSPGTPLIRSLPHKLSSGEASATYCPSYQRRQSSTVPTFTQ